MYPGYGGAGGPGGRAGGRPGAGRGATGRGAGGGGVGAGAGRTPGGRKLGGGQANEASYPVGGTYGWRFVRNWSNALLYAVGGYCCASCGPRAIRCCCNPICPDIWAL